MSFVRWFGCVTVANIFLHSQWWIEQVRRIPHWFSSYSTTFFSEFNVVRPQVESSLFAKKKNPNLKSLNIYSKYTSSQSISTNIGAESMWRSLMYWLRVEQNRVTCNLTESFDSWSMFLIRLSITGDESQGIYGSDSDGWWLGSMPRWQLSSMSGGIIISLLRFYKSVVWFLSYLSSVSQVI